MKKVTINDTSKLLEGFFEACNATICTMGTEGAFAILKDNFLNAPVVTKDGVSVVKEVAFKNPHKNMGAFFAKQAAGKTLLKVGDNTTTCLVFAKALVENTKKETKSFWPWKKSKADYYFNSKVKEGMDLASEEVKKYLAEIAAPTNNVNIKSIANIASNGDEEVTKLVTEAFLTVGATGTIDVQENFDNPKTSLKVTEGFRFSKGWKSPFLINNKENGTFEAENANILVYEGIISPQNAQDIANFIELKANEPIVIICERIIDDTVLNIIDMHQKKILNICVIEAPFYDVERKSFMQDIALYTDTEVYVQGTTKQYSFGRASKIIIEEESTSIIQEELNPKVSKRIADLRGQLETTTNKDFLKKTIAALEGKAAIISVGDFLEGSRKERFDRCEDAVFAVKAAVEEGVVSGGGSSLVYIASQMKSKFENKDIQFGYDTVKKSICAPFETILSNAKINPEDFKAVAKEYGVGYNVRTHEVEDFLETGVLDSAKGIRVALENAVSTSTLLLNTKVIII